VREAIGVFLAPQEVRERYRVSNAWLDRHVRDKTFPAPVKLGAAFNAPRRWKLSDLKKFDAKLTKATLS
jgi:predicted DNA-binding transcriptional regulator AlpA